MSKFKNVVFQKDGGFNEGNVVDNSINIKPVQRTILTIGTLWIPVFYEQGTNKPYINKIKEIVSEPIPAEFPTDLGNTTNIKATYGESVKVKTIIETKQRYYINSKTKVKGWGQLLNGNTYLNAGSKGNAKKPLFEEFKNFLSFAIREN
jgi:hypothetical protein